MFFTNRPFFRRLMALAPLVISGCLLTHCQTTSQRPQGEYLIQIQRGDTLSGIAHRFDTTPYALAKLNRLRLPVRLRVGESLRVIPGPSGVMAGTELRPISVDPSGSTGQLLDQEKQSPAADPSEFTKSDFPSISPTQDQGKAPAGKRTTAPQQSGRKGLFFGGSVDPSPRDQDPLASADPLIDQDFLVESSPIRDELLALEPLRWPLRGSITSHFGDRRGHFHKGVDIKAPHGSPIVPAAEGKVLFAGRKKSYGKVVILQHRFHQTLYAHLSAIKVRKGDWVDLKRVIGHVGATGNARGTHLHFEVIDASLAAVDPVAVMTKSHSYRLARISGERDLRNPGSTRIQ